MSQISIPSSERTVLIAFHADVELRNKLDEVRARVARETGRRPRLRELLSQALTDFVRRELGAGRSNAASGAEGSHGR